MNKPVVARIARSVCPHDCPSTCALDVEIVDERTIGRVRGAKDDPYTAGVICEKVARYAERIHHADRLTHPLRRVGPKGAGQWQRITWDEAFDEIVPRWEAIEAEFGPEAIWPYFYAGTMGHVHRDGINRLRHARGYSEQYDTICTGAAWPGYLAGPLEVPVPKGPLESLIAASRWHPLQRASALLQGRPKREHSIPSALGRGIARGIRMVRKDRSIRRVAAERARRAGA